MMIVATSDTHSKHERLTLPPGDVFVHAGDSNMFNKDTAEDFIKWVGSLAYEHKIIIAGNHDWEAERNPALIEKLCKDNGVIYLNDSGCEIDGVKFWGSPVTPIFYDWAFMRSRSYSEFVHTGFKYPLIKEHWDKIPRDIDVLITHGPPYDILDVNFEGGRCGDVELRKAIEEIKPRVHIFGHIHECGGEMERIDDTFFYNVTFLGKVKKRGNQYELLFNDVQTIPVDIPDIK
jgi:Icc-related predicted phosphoesterase